jgi:hypothetical protein
MSIGSDKANRAPIRRACNGPTKPVSGGSDERKRFTSGNAATADSKIVDVTAIELGGERVA